MLGIGGIPSSPMKKKPSGQANTTPDGVVTVMAASERDCLQVAVSLSIKESLMKPSVTAASSVVLVIQEIPSRPLRHPFPSP
jgi:hypothetical protein